mmetsp:Transcript_57511/g.132561  ORF Transcript_57511/g.132561 Transcript_57511/m.132561 type:complete len:219 (+) Transcript_57511:455-1111(+)
MSHDCSGVHLGVALVQGVHGLQEIPHHALSGGSPLPSQPPAADASHKTPQHPADPVLFQLQHHRRAVQRPDRHKRRQRHGVRRPEQPRQRPQRPPPGGRRRPRIGRARARVRHGQVLGVTVRLRAIVLPAEGRRRRRYAAEHAQHQADGEVHRGQDRQTPLRLAHPPTTRALRPTRSYRALQARGVRCVRASFCLTYPRGRYNCNCFKLGRGPRRPRR